LGRVCGDLSLGSKMTANSEPDRMQFRFWPQRS